jgi:uncharacterized protein YhfF
MKDSKQVEEYWQEFCKVSGIDPKTPYQSWYFGDTLEQADKLLELVLEGKKRATSTLVWEMETEPEETPVLNGYNVVTDFDGNPKCVIQTTELRVLPFNEVDAEYAFAEGEGDQSLDYWRQVHWKFFSNICLKIDREPSMEMPLYCERFKLLYPQND